MTNSNNIIRIVERKSTLTAPERHSTVRSAAQNLSRRNVDAATTELLNDALARLTALCYERDDSGVLCNIDPVTGRVIVPLPWGRVGYRKWGLTPTESNAMRAIMFTRQSLGLPLYFYDRSRRAWFINFRDYRDGGVVLAQLKEWEITVGEYRRARNAV